jgi:hypothetical protein
MTSEEMPRDVLRRGGEDLRRMPSCGGSGEGRQMTFNLRKLTQKQLRVLRALSLLDPARPFWRQAKRFRAVAKTSSSWFAYDFRRVKPLEERGLVMRRLVGQRGGVSFVLTPKGWRVLRSEEHRR